MDRCETCGREYPNTFEDRFMRFDRSSRQVFTQGIKKEEVPLTALQYAVLDALVLNVGRAVSQESLVKTVWGHDEYGITHYDTYLVKWHISNLRKKMPQGWPLSTVRGYGYRYEAVPWY